MLAGLSSNAVSAKARGMHGKRLNNSNFMDLLNCKTIHDVAYYLKNRTSYNKILAEINENEITRSQLEVLLKQKIFADCSDLGKYGAAVGERFSDYLIMRSEIEQVMHSLILLNSGKNDDYVIYMPEFLQKKTGIDLGALRQIKTFDDLIKSLGNTPYAKVIAPFKPEQNKLLDYTKIENALYTFLYHNVFTMIKKHYKGGAAKQLRDIFNSYLDLDNYVRIVRMKSFYKAPPEAIRNALLPFSTIRKHFIDAMINAKDEEEVHAIMSQTSVGKRFLKDQDAFEDDIPLRVQYETAKHHIHFSTHPSVVLLSYIFVKQAEVYDVITILEGIRYHLAPSKIAKLLTIVNFQ